MCFVFCVYYLFTLFGARGTGRVETDHLKAVLCIKQEVSFLYMLYVILPFDFLRILNSFMVILLVLRDGFQKKSMMTSYLTLGE